MTVSLAWRACGVVLALCLASVLPEHADGGDVLWQIEGDGAGFGQIQYVTEDGNRLLAVGAAGRWNGPEKAHPLVRLHDAATGTVLWSHRGTAPGYVSHAVLKGARAYISGGDGDFLVRAHDAHTGAVVWEDRHDVSTSTPGTDGFAHAVAFAGGRLFAVGYYGDGIPTVLGTMIRAYDAATGRLLWQENRPWEIFGTSTQRSMIAVGGHVIVALTGLPTAGSPMTIFVRAHNASTGATVWEDRYSANNYGDARAAIFNVANRVFVTGVLGNSDGFTDLTVRAYDGTSGAVLWHDVRSEPGGVSHESVGIATAGSYVVAAANLYREDGFPTLLRALDTASGTLLWETIEPDVAYLTDVAIVGDRVISVGCVGDGPIGTLVRTHDLRTGTRQWQEHHEVAGGISSCASAVSAAPGRVVIGGGSTSASNETSILMRAYRPR
jgi:outer membrane protein assembly factor BamB